MSRAGLLDVIQNRISDTAYQSDCSNPCDNRSEDPLYKSVIKHIEVLLTARQGCLVHMPDYGVVELPLLDSTTIYESLRLAAKIKSYIIKYEPRIGELEVNLCAPEMIGEHIAEIVICGSLLGSGYQDYITMRYVVRSDGSIAPRR